jgi:uncharacterized SAM-binding protein YcdF (DUF218 family)
MVFYLGKILNALILPPGLFILILLTLVFIIKKSKKWLAFILWVVLILIYLTSITPTRVLLTSRLERAYPPISSQEKPDAIIVLAAGVVSDSLEAPNEESPSPTTLKRLMYAYKLHQQSGADLILSGGFHPKGGSSEAEIMKKELLELGVAESKIIVESKSKNTFENAQFCQKITKSRGFKNVALVTSAIHMPRAVMTFKSAGLKVTPAPTDYLGKPHSINLFYFLPSAENLSAVTAALHEYFGFLYYWVVY